MTNYRQFFAVTAGLYLFSAVWAFAANQSSASFNIDADVFSQGSGPVASESASFSVTRSLGQKAITGEGYGTTLSAWFGFQAQIDGVNGGGGNDSDSDGMDDTWENLWFGNLDHPADEDYDHDGLNNLLESQMGSDPTGRTAPSWWTAYSIIITDGATTNDYAAVNSGQLKWIATNAYSEIIAQHGSAGATLDGIVPGFTSTNDYYAVNIGQLKFIAKPFYDRLSEVSRASAGVYPWTGAATTNDFAPVNIGQIKHVFSFQIQ